jgi:hypothetical protein
MDHSEWQWSAVFIASNKYGKTVITALPYKFIRQSQLAIAVLAKIYHIM